MSNFIYPRFSDEKEFELFVNEIFKKRTSNINFQIYGRKGQKQYGIDGYGYDFVNNEFIVTQCKNYNSDKEGKKSFKKDFLEALKLFDKEELPFKNKVQKFYYVTSVSRDNKISDKEESELNLGRTIPFKIFTWEELCDELERHNDILYHFFLKKLPSGKAKNIEFQLQNIENTITLKFGEQNIEDQIKQFKEIFIEKVNISKEFHNKANNKSTLILGLDGGFKQNLLGETDLNLDFSIIYKDNNKAGLDNFLTLITTEINILKSEIGLEKIIIKSHIQPCLAIYIGKFFKESTSGIEFISLINKKQIFISSISENLLYSEPGITEKKLYINKDDGNKNNIALFYNVSQSNLEIENELSKEIFRQVKPMYGFYLIGNRIEDSSHGFSQIKYVVEKIKTIANEYQNSGEKLNIHLVLICPEQIAFIIGTLIEKVNSDIYLYYQTIDSTNYILFDKLPKK